MKKILDESMKPAFMRYAIERRNNHPIDMPLTYLTDKIFDRTFDYFVRHKLTIEANAKSYWYKSGEKQIECYGYSGRDINFRDDEDGIINNLFHEVWCKAEWAARGKGKEYEDVCKQYFGVQAYNKICA